MKKQNPRRLGSWQIVVITLGVVLVLGPLAWDTLGALSRGFPDLRLQGIFSGGVMFVAGLVLLLIVGIYELVKDARDKPTSKHIK